MTSAVRQTRNANDFADVRRFADKIAHGALYDFGRGVWIHGAGSFGRSVARALSAAGVMVLGFIDRKGTDRMLLDGLRVVRSDALDADEVDGAFHVHALMNHYAPSREVTDWAVKRGFAGVLFPADLYRIPGYALCNYWLAPPAETIAYLDELEVVFHNLGDEESKRLLDGVLRYRLTADPRLHPGVDMAQAYVPDFLPIFDRPITFIDGGAYRGDTLEALLARQVVIADWVAFEPDSRNMRDLRISALQHKERLGSYTLLQLGLSDRDGTVAFADGAGESSCVIDDCTDTEATRIGVVRLDDAIERRGNLYVKLDIEGGEMEALRGMPRLLDSKPLLAISIYHKPRDLWEIPLWFIRRGIPAEFRIRQHGHHGFDTVLYVIPR